MISQLTGEIVDNSGTFVVMNVSGVGFHILCTPGTSAGLQVGATTRLFTALVVREDALTLYGFSQEVERQSFLLVQSVSGIGPKLALSIVAHMSAGDLTTAIRAENAVSLTKIPGLGTKTASRMILELKDKTLDLGLAVSSLSSSPHHLHEQVIDGLQGLGYSSKDAENAWESITELAATPEVTVSVLMRAALQSLARS